MKEKSLIRKVLKQTKVFSENLTNLLIDPENPFRIPENGHGGGMKKVFTIFTEYMRAIDFHQAVVERFELYKESLTLLDGISIEENLESLFAQLNSLILGMNSIGEEMNFEVELINWGIGQFNLSADYFNSIQTKIEYGKPMEVFPKVSFLPNIYPKKNTSNLIKKPKILKQRTIISFTRELRNIKRLRFLSPLEEEEHLKAFLKRKRAKFFKTGKDQQDHKIEKFFPKCSEKLDLKVELENSERSILSDMEEFNYNRIGKRFQRQHIGALLEHSSDEEENN